MRKMSKEEGIREAICGNTAVVVKDEFGQSVAARCLSVEELYKYNEFFFQTSAYSCSGRETVRATSSGVIALQIPMHLAGQKIDVEWKPRP